MPQNGSRYLLQFGRQGMVAHQNRWLAGPDELAVAENTCFENDLVQKEPAAPEYDLIGVAVEGPAGTLSTASDLTMQALWLQASSTTALVNTVFTGVLSQASPWTFTLTATATAGNLALLAIGQTNNPTDNPIATSVVDAKGNIWTKLMTRPGSVSINAAVELWASVLTTTLTSGVDTITVTFTTAAADNRAANVTTYSGVTSVTNRASAAAALDTASAFGVTPTPGYTASAYPALLLAGLEFNKINTTTPTWTGGFTEAARASSASVASQLSVAWKLAAFAPSIVAQIDYKADQESSPAGTVS